MVLNIWTRLETILCTTNKINWAFIKSECCEGACSSGRTLQCFLFFVFCEKAQERNEKKKKEKTRAIYIERERARRAAEMEWKGQRAGWIH